MNFGPCADCGWRIDRYNGSFASIRATIAGRLGTVLGTVDRGRLCNCRETLEILSNFDTVRWPRG
jgi:hypothetical protein